MKTRGLSPVAIGAAALLLALMVGCPNPVGWHKSGSLTVSIKNNINAKTLLPSISMDAASYTINGAGPKGATFSASTSGDPVTVDGLALGSWTITVNALNAGSTVIGQGQGTVAVNAGENAVLAIAVTPLSGMGSLNLTVIWAASLQKPSIQASLTPSPSGSVIVLDFGAISGTHATYSSSTIPAGYYTLTLQLLGNNLTEAGAVEVVRIVAGQTTSGTYSFVGTVVVNITPALANPIPVSISGVPPTVPVGTSMIATASVGDGTTDVDYTWYLNGGSPGSGAELWFRE